MYIVCTYIHTYIQVGNDPAVGSLRNKFAFTDSFAEKLDRWSHQSGVSRLTHDPLAGLGV